jgi:hypothetical protein
MMNESDCTEVRSPNGPQTDKAGLVAALEVAQRHGGAEPDILSEWLKHDAPVAVGGVRPDGKPLRRAGAHLDHQILVTRPVGWHVGIQILQREFFLRLDPGEHKPLNRAASHLGVGGAARIKQNPGEQRAGGKEVFQVHK